MMLVSTGMQVDYTGLSTVIAASVAGIVSLGTFGMQVVSWNDQRKLKMSQDEIKIAADNRDAKLDHLTTVVTKTADAVNGISDQRVALASQVSFAAGVKEGTDTERANAAAR